MRPDADAWIAAGGAAEKLALYSSIGTVAPFADRTGRCLASIHPELPRIGAIGDWTGDPILLAHAEDWLRERGCRVLRGPMELCTWFSYRVNLGPHGDAPFVLEPQERPERWLEAGYEAVSHYTSTLDDGEAAIQKAAAIRRDREAEGWRLRALGTAAGQPLSPDAWREAVALIHRLSSVAFAEAWGYGSVPEAAIQAWYAPYRTVVDPRLVFVLTNPAGEAAGFLFGLADLAAPDRGWFLIKTMAVVPGYQGLGLGNWLVGEAHAVARGLGFRGGVHALMWAESRSNHLGAKARLIRRYACLEKRA